MTAAAAPLSAAVIAAAEGALAEWAALAECPKELLVDGRWRPARSGRTLAVEDPSTGEAICAVADADEADALDALAATHAARGAWAATPARERARVLRRAADELARRSETLAMLITLEMGKPLAESPTRSPSPREYLEWCAEEAVRVAGTCSTAPDGRPAHGPSPARRAVPDRHALELPPRRARAAASPRPSRPAAPSSCAPRR